MDYGIAGSAGRAPLRNNGGLARRGEPVALILTALAPQLFRDLVVRSFCVSRFTVQVKSSQVYTKNNRQPYGSLSNVLRRPAVVEGSGRR